MPSLSEKIKFQFRTSTLMYPKEYRRHFKSLYPSERLLLEKILDSRKIDEFENAEFVSFRDHLFSFKYKNETANVYSAVHCFFYYPDFSNSFGKEVIDIDGVPPHNCWFAVNNVLAFEQNGNIIALGANQLYDRYPNNLAITKSNVDGFLNKGIDVAFINRPTKPSILLANDDTIKFFGAVKIKDQQHFEHFLNNYAEVRQQAMIKKIIEDRQNQLSI